MLTALSLTDNPLSASWRSTFLRHPVPAHSLSELYILSFFGTQSFLPFYFGHLYCGSPLKMLHYIIFWLQTHPHPCRIFTIDILYFFSWCNCVRVNILNAKLIIYGIKDHKHKAWFGDDASKQKYRQTTNRYPKTMHYAIRAMGAMTLRISKLCLSFSPPPIIPDGNFNLVHHFICVQIFQINKKGTTWIGTRWTNIVVIDVLKRTENKKN